MEALLDKLTLKAFREMPGLPLKVKPFLIAAFTLGARTTKSVQLEVNTYRDALSKIAFDTMKGEMSAAEMARSHRNLLRLHDTRAYFEGMRSGGIDDPAGELSEKDDQQISAWTSQQLRFVKGLADACEAIYEMPKEDKEEARLAVIDRIDQWASSLDALGQLGFASAKENVMVTFRLGATEKHCRTCGRLNGTRHRLKWFVDRGFLPGQNGNAKFECMGFNCDCSLADDQGQQVYP